MRKYQGAALMNASLDDFKWPGDAMPAASDCIVPLARERRGHAPQAPWPASDIAGARLRASARAVPVPTPVDPSAPVFETAAFISGVDTPPWEIL